MDFIIFEIYINYYEKTFYIKTKKRLDLTKNKIKSLIFHGRG